MQALKQFDPSLSFPTVFQALDGEFFGLSSQQAFDFLDRVWMEAGCSGRIGELVRKPWKFIRMLLVLLLMMNDDE